MLTKKTSRNQVTIPKEIACNFTGAEYFDVSADDHRIILTPVKITSINAISLTQEKLKKLGITENAVSEAITWARKRKRSK